MAWLSRLPIFWQTLLLLVAALVASTGINIALIFALPAPRVDFYTVRDMADALQDPVRSRAGQISDAKLHLSTGDRAPATGKAGNGWLVENGRFTERLAARLDVPVENVRLVYQKSQGNWPYRTGGDEGGVPLRLGEPQFYNTAIGAVRRADGMWRIVETPERPTLSRSLQRWLVTFFLAFMSLLPFAYLFARHIAQPIRRFAEAAERVGNDTEAPPVPVEGSTEVRLAAQSLNVMQTRLCETLAERTAMIGAIAHDLRTPLARIAFRIERADAGVRKAVLADIEQMRAMVSATIAFVIRGTELGERHRVDLHQILERIVGDAQAMDQKVELSGGKAWVVGDAVALERLVQNVLDNAINYAGSAEIELDSRFGRTSVTVADRGPGLSESMLENVFKPFNRGEPSRNRSTGGVGLGLSIARSIALAHEGSLRAINRDGGGLIVEATFPAA